MGGQCDTFNKLGFWGKQDVMTWDAGVRWGFKEKMGTNGGRLG